MVSRHSSSGGTFHANYLVTMHILTEHIDEPPREDPPLGDAPDAAEPKQPLVAETSSHQTGAVREEGEENQPEMMRDDLPVPDIDNDVFACDSDIASLPRIVSEVVDEGFDQCNNAQDLANMESGGTHNALTGSGYGPVTPRAPEAEMQATNSFSVTPEQLIPVNRTAMSTSRSDSFTDPDLQHGATSRMWEQRNERAQIDRSGQGPSTLTQAATPSRSDQLPPALQRPKTPTVRNVAGPSVHRRPSSGMHSSPRSTSWGDQTASPMSERERLYRERRRKAQQQRDTVERLTTPWIESDL